MPTKSSQNAPLTIASNADRLAIVQSINDIWEFWNSKPLTNLCPLLSKRFGKRTKRTTPTLALYPLPGGEAPLGSASVMVKIQELIERGKCMTLYSAETDEEVVTGKLQVDSPTAVS